MATPNKTDVFKFMSVRSPRSIEPKKLRHFYIQDQYISSTDQNDQAEMPTRKLREIFSMNGESQIGRILYEKIFCEDSDNEIKDKNVETVQAVLETLQYKSVFCEIVEEPVSPAETLINDLEQFPYVYSDGKYYLLPAKLETIICEFDIKKLLAAKKIIKKHIKSFDQAALLRELHTVFGVNDLTTVIYENAEYASNYQQLRNTLFEKLYTLYILRRLTSINLEHIIEGLQTLHTLEFLAVDDFLNGIISGRLNPSNQTVRDTAAFLPHLFNELQNINLLATTNTFFFIKTEEDLSNYFQSTPIIHPIVAELHWYRRPRNFNNIRPIGLGDLKVVKQWLCGYKAGEISHIHNIMKNEEKERNHRHLEKTEEVFSFSSEQSEDNQRESQTTDRFEMKKEAEKVIKTDLNVSAHIDFTYKNSFITANVGGNFAYTNSNQDTQRSASNYARDVMDKAVTQIQSRTTQQRSITKIYETEETNKHKFINTQTGATHISGIYRWLDKQYKAQLYNYGQRWMFEFIVPEPASFYVQSKLRAAEFEITAPVKPSVKYNRVKIMHPTTPNVELSPEHIDDKAVFNKLRRIYDLPEFTYPIESKMVTAVNQTTGKSLLSNDFGPSGSQSWRSDRYTFQIEDKGFNVTEFSVFGQARFEDQIGEVSTRSYEINTFQILINGLLAIETFPPNTSTIENPGLSLRGDYDKAALNNKVFNVQNGEINIDLNFQDALWYQISISLYLELDAQYKLDWQTKVYNKIKDIEQKKIDKINQEKEIAYNAAMADYRSKLNELNAQTVNDIIQGRSEAFNRQIIRDELKKHCITMIAKEFDAFEDDDILSNEDADAIENKQVHITYDKFFAGEVDVKDEDGAVKRDENGNVTTETVAGFVPISKDVDYPKINIDKAKKKERFIQFLEQAFEWQQIAYIFYPYFWAAENKWMTLMNRLDYTDNNMTAFLKAGSVRVLIAVTPGYYDAVMHFLATREPWEGGPLPVIGDPLFIPIYEEIRKQQDDLQNATPEGEPWPFEVPTSLIYLHDSSSPIPDDLKCAD